MKINLKKDLVLEPLAQVKIHTKCETVQKENQNKIFGPENIFIFEPGILLNALINFPLNFVHIA